MLQYIKRSLENLKHPSIYSSSMTHFILLRVSLIRSVSREHGCRWGEVGIHPAWLCSPSQHMMRWLYTKLFQKQWFIHSIKTTITERYIIFFYCMQFDKKKKEIINKNIQTILYIKKKKKKKKCLRQIHSRSCPWSNLCHYLYLYIKISIHFLKISL